MNPAGFAPVVRHDPDGHRPIHSTERKKTMMSSNPPHDAPAVIRRAGPPPAVRGCESLAPEAPPPITCAAHTVARGPRRALGTVLMLLACAMALTGPETAARGTQVSTAATTNDGAKWRIGYYEGGPYLQYLQTLQATVKGLMKLGWIEPVTLPPQDGEETAALWQWLSKNARSRYVEFVADAHYSVSWDDKRRAAVSEEVLQRLASGNDLDLLIAMGTWAGKDFANDRHGTPTVVMSTSDPLSAGIIKSVEDSGLAHLHARVDPDRYKRQLTVFHEITRFKRLGVAYEDSVNGRSYAALEDVRELSRSRGFEVEECHTRSDIADTRAAETSVEECIERLVRTADAIYVTEQGGVTRRSIPRLVRIANEHHVPTFSQAGPGEVELGIMVSLSQAGFRYVGEFHAETIARIFNGAKPNDLEQLFEEPPKIAINLKTAELVGFDPPVVLLGAADEIFHEIRGHD